jgi:hypothetical protein
MFRTIISTLPRDKDYPARAFTLDVYRRILDGSFYEHLPSSFHQETNDAGEYIPLRQRRPSVKYGLPRIVVEDSVSLLFAEGHFPEPQCDTPEAKDALKALIKEACLNSVMIEAATIGSVGSVAIHLRVLEQKNGGHRAFFEPKCTDYLTPVYEPTNPQELAKIEERYKVKGEVLKATGYPIPDDKLSADYWFGRDWDDKEETWYQPWIVSRDLGEQPASPVRDADKSVAHDLGFVPWVWVKNLPGKLRLIDSPKPAYSDIDGACTFAAAIDMMIEIDYQLSQAGRGLKYGMDPQLVLKEPAAASGPGSEMVKSPSKALVMDKDGDAKLLELNGGAFEVVLEYVKALREMGLENVHGNRAEASKLSSAQSGRAMELMNQALIWLADRLRISYGEGALLSLLKMTAKANEKYQLTVAGKPMPPVTDEITLKWAPWHEPTYSDLKEEAGTVEILTKAGVMSRETAVGSIAANYDIEDVPAELARIAKDVAEASAVLTAQGAQPKPAEEAPI